MKIVYLIIITLSFSIKTYSQQVPIKTNPTVDSLKSYLSKNIKYPAIEVKNYTQGSMIISFQLNENKRISDVHFVRHLTSECDSEVLKVIKNYSHVLSLPSDKYTISFLFLLLDDGKPDSEITPFNGDLYKNFLFELKIEEESIKTITKVSMH